MPAEVSISQQVGRMQNEKLKKLNNRKDKPKMANEKQREGDKSIHFIIHNSFAGNKQYAQERQVVRMKQKKTQAKYIYYCRFISMQDLLHLQYFHAKLEFSKSMESIKAYSLVLNHSVV